MAYSSDESKKAVLILQVMLAAETGGEMDIVAFIDDPSFAYYIPDQDDRVNLVLDRAGKEWRTNNLVIVPPANAVGSYDLTGLSDAAGDGRVGFTLDGVTYLAGDGGNVPAGTTAIAAAASLAASVNGYELNTFTAIASASGLVTITSVYEEGESGNTFTITDLTTDTTLTGAVITNFAGGVDGSLTGEVRIASNEKMFDGSTRS